MYIEPIPLILWLVLWWVLFRIKPSSQFESISQCLHASDRFPSAQIHSVIDFTAMCLRCHSFAEHKCLVWRHNNQQSDYVFRGNMSSLENSGMSDRQACSSQILYSVFVKLNQNNSKYWDGNVVKCEIERALINKIFLYEYPLISSGMNILSSSFSCWQTSDANMFG